MLPYGGNGRRRAGGQVCGASGGPWGGRWEQVHLQQIPAGWEPVPTPTLNLLTWLLLLISRKTGSDGREKVALS